MREQLFWMRPSVFGLALFCFLLPFASVSCRGEIPDIGSMVMAMGGGAAQAQPTSKVELVSSLSGLDLVKGKKGEDVAKELVSGLSEKGLPVGNDDFNPSASDKENVGPYSWAIVAALCALSGLLLAFSASVLTARISIPLAIAGVVSLVLLKPQVAKDLELESAVTMEGIRIGLDWLYGYGLALVLFVLAIPLSVYASGALREEAPAPVRRATMYMADPLSQTPTPASPPYSPVGPAAPAPAASPVAAGPAAPGVVRMVCPNPDCGKPLTIPGQYRGQHGVCKHCHGPVRVPE